MAIKKSVGKCQKNNMFQAKFTSCCYTCYLNRSKSVFMSRNQWRRKGDFRRILNQLLFVIKQLFYLIVDEISWCLKLFFFIYLINIHI